MRYGPMSLGFSVAALAAGVGALTFRRDRPVEPASDVTAADSVAAAARVSYALLDLKRTQPDDRAALLRLHGDEIRRSFEVAGVVMRDSVTVVLVRYSIGPRVYHDVHWVRRVGTDWHPTDDPSSLREAADPFKDGKPDSARVVIDAAVKWLKEGAPRWW